MIFDTGDIRGTLTAISPEGLEPLDDHPVVDDLVVAVDGWLEGPDHPGECLDRHLDSGAEATGCGEEHLVDVHARTLGAGRTLSVMSTPRVVAVAPDSPAAQADTFTL